MIIYDTETTGLIKAEKVDLNKQPRIIEYFALKVCEKTFEVEGELDLLINPGEDITKEITDITSITNEMLVGKPRFPQVWEQIADFHVGQKILVAHNIMFDLDMLTFELQRIGKVRNFPWPTRHICTVEISEHYFGRRLKLGDLHKHITGNSLQNAHRARNDVIGTFECLKAMIAAGDYDI